MAEHSVFETSWHLAAEIARRNDDLNVVETHPGGGLYDCLALFGEPHEPPLIAINREGSIFVRGEKAMTPEEWTSLRTSASIREAAMVLLSRAGLPAPAHARPTTRKTLAYRVIAVMHSTSEIDARSAERNSSAGSYIDEDAIKDVDELRNAPPREVWIIRRPDRTVAARLWKNWAYTAGNERLDLYRHYRRGTTIDDLVFEVLG